jgi:class 3 adenylate cyclase
MGQTETAQGEDRTGDRGEREMPEHTNRTFICSVLFLDIVEYSQRSVAEQIALKERFNKVLTEAIVGVPTDDRIILDTGDGAAVSFLGDPEDTLFAGMSLREAVASQQASPGPRLQIRVGVNLGPVRLVKDINGNPNIIGDGINVAQRIMSFAEPGQILVSRSYYDVMARLSEDFARLFNYEGAKTDKHVREHEVYAIGSNSGGLKRTIPLPAPRQTMRLPTLSMPPFLKVNPKRWPEVLAVNSKLFVVAPLAFTLIVGTGVIARSHRDDDKPAPPVRVALAPRAEAAPAKAAASDPPPAVERKAEEPKTKEPVPAHKAKDESPKTSAPAQIAKPAQTAKTGGADTATPKAKEPEIALAAPAVREGTINIIALPWAEVFVDGTRQGVSPPLKAIPLKPGKHRVELRNGSFPPHVQTVDLRPGAEISVTHRFRR